MASTRNNLQLFIKHPRFLSLYPHSLFYIFLLLKVYIIQPYVLLISNQRVENDDDDE